MLVLSRKVNETIVLTLEDGRIIKLMLVESRIGNAEIGITADKSIVVHRGEIQLEAEAAQRERDNQYEPGFGEHHA